MDHHNSKSKTNILKFYSASAPHRKGTGQSELQYFYVRMANEGKADSFLGVAFTMYPSSFQLQEILFGILPSMWLHNK